MSRSWAPGMSPVRSRRRRCCHRPPPGQGGRVRVATRGCGLSGPGPPGRAESQRRGGRGGGPDPGTVLPGGEAVLLGGQEARWGQWAGDPSDPAISEREIDLLGPGERAPGRPSFPRRAGGSGRGRRPVEEGALPFRGERQSVPRAAVDPLDRALLEVPGDQEWESPATERSVEQEEHLVREGTPRPAVLRSGRCFRRSRRGLTSVSVASSFPSTKSTACWRLDCVSSWATKAPPGSGRDQMQAPNGDLGVPVIR